MLTLGWLLMSLLVFGVDETVDPAKFALLPVRARELLPGLLVSRAWSAARGRAPCWWRSVWSSPGPVRSR